MNLIVIEGNITKTPEVTYTQSGTALLKISVAVNYIRLRAATPGQESKDREEEAAFVPITLWGKTAEFIGKYAEKGTKICVKGRFSQDHWKDKESGQNRHKLYVTGEMANIIDMSMFKANKQEDPGFTKESEGAFSQAVRKISSATKASKDVFS